MLTGLREVWAAQSVAVMCFQFDSVAFLFYIGFDFLLETFWLIELSFIKVEVAMEKVFYIDY